MELLICIKFGHGLFFYPDRTFTSISVAYLFELNFSLASYQTPYRPISSHHAQMVGYILDSRWAWTHDILSRMVVATASIDEEEEAIGPIFFTFSRCFLKVFLFFLLPSLSFSPLVNHPCCKYTSIAAIVFSSRLYLRSSM